MRLMLSAGGRRAAVAAAAGALCGAFFLEGLFASRQQSPTLDEPNHIASGLSYIATRHIVANPQHPPLMKEMSGLSLALAGVRWPAALTPEEMANRPPGWEWPVGYDILIRNGVDRTLFQARLPMLLLSLLLGFVMYLFGRELAGDAAGLCALFLLVADPTMVAHSYLVTTDVGVATFGLLFLLALLRYLKKPGIGRLLFAGISLGLALGAKFSAIFLLPIAACLLVAGHQWPFSSEPGARRTFFDLFRGRGAIAGKPRPATWTRLASAGCALAAMCVLAVPVIQLLYFSPRGPILYSQGMGKVNADHDPNFLAYLGGELQHRFASYFAVAYLVKEPLACIALLLFGAVLIKRSRTLPRLYKLFLWLPPAVFFLACTLWAGNIGFRYLIPALPFAYAAGGIALATLLQGSARWNRPVAAALCCWLLLTAAGIYPDGLAYFNEAACLPFYPDRIGFDGGSRCGPQWLDDSNVDWGQGLKQLKAWLDRNAMGRTVRLEVFGNFPLSAYGIVTEDASPYLVPQPSPGLYAISAHTVADAPVLGGIDWLRRTDPVAIVGHAYYIYDIR